MKMRRIGAREGFALPITIFLVTLLTIMLSAAFTRVSVDRQITDSSEATVEALSVAQSGLQTFLGDTFTVPPASGDSIRYNVLGGYAWVTPTVMRKPQDSLKNWTFIVRSTGYVIEPTMGSTPQAQRTVAQFAEWQTGSLKLLGALTGLNEIEERNNSDTVRIDGFEQSPACGTNDMVGLRVPTGENDLNTRPETIVTGSPTGIDESGSTTIVADSTDIDWAGVLAGQLQADTNDWISGNSTTYPIQLINGDLNIVNIVGNSSGQGLLVVTGNLRVFSLFGSFTWNGPILVGGRAEFEAQRTEIRGALWTGLDAIVGGNPPKTRIGGKLIWERDFFLLNCSDNVFKSLASLTGFVPIQNAWVDNWAEY